MLIDDPRSDLSFFLVGEVLEVLDLSVRWRDIRMHVVHVVSVVWQGAARQVELFKISPPEAAAFLLAAFNSTSVHHPVGHAPFADQTACFAIQQ